MIEYRTGDLFAQHDVQALAHGVNCVGVMGAGIAPLFKNRFPGMYEQYLLQCQTRYLFPGTVFAWRLDPTFAPLEVIFNIASQDKPGANASIYWLELGLSETLHQANKLGLKSIALPRIGAGIGGLDWSDVKAVYEQNAELWPEVNLVVVSLPGA